MSALRNLLMNRPDILISVTPRLRFPKHRRIFAVLVIIS